MKNRTGVFAIALILTIYLVLLLVPAAYATVVEGSSDAPQTDTTVQGTTPTATGTMTSDCPDPRGRGRVQCEAVTSLPSTGAAVALFTVIGAGVMTTGYMLVRKHRA